MLFLFFSFLFIFFSVLWLCLTERTTRNWEESVPCPWSPENEQVTRLLLLPQSKKGAQETRRRFRRKLDAEVVISFLLLSSPSFLSLAWRHRSLVIFVAVAFQYIFYWSSKPLHADDYPDTRREGCHGLPQPCHDLPMRATYEMEEIMEEHSMLWIECCHAQNEPCHTMDHFMMLLWGVMCGEEELFLFSSHMPLAIFHCLSNGRGGREWTRKQCKARMRWLRWERQAAEPRHFPHASFISPSASLQFTYFHFICWCYNMRCRVTVVDGGDFYAFYACCCFCLFLFLL